jgi:hypothetical protein
MSTIINTIEEFQQHFPTTYTESNFKRLIPYIKIAQRDYLLPILGDELLTALIEEENGSGSGSGAIGSESGNSGSSCIASLLPYAQTVAAFMAIFEGFSQLEISIGVDGIVQNSSDAEKQPIYSGQRTDAKRDILRHGMNAAEEMLLFLEKNKEKECFKDWAASDERTDMLGHILPTAKVFTQYWSSMDNKRLTYMALRSRMIDVETITVQGLLGKPLYKKVMAELKDETTEATDDLLIFLRPMVAKLTALRGMPELQLQVEAFGVYHNLIDKNEKSTQVLKTADESRMQKVEDRLQLEADALRSDLICHLHNNIDDYPLFKESTNYVALDEEEEEDTTPPATSGSMPYRL